MENSFGDFLRQKRQEKNLTQKELASLLFVSESAVSKWEKNVARPDISLLPKLSEILSISEHELITASVDHNARTDKTQAKKWRTLTTTWNLFFYIAYGITILTCFICNLAVSKTLSWFWIVLSSLILAFTFTNLPSIVKKHKLIFLPLSSYLALCLLLGVCCLYTGGKWFLIPTISVLFILVIIFSPIYISKYKAFDKIKKVNAFISVAIDFITLNILLLVIYFYTVNNGYAFENWYLTVALPIVSTIYLMLNILLCVRFLRVNKLIKTSIVLFLCDLFLYGTPLLVKTDNIELQSELNNLKFFNANFVNWIGEQIEINVHCIIFIATLLLSAKFLISGLIIHYKKKK